MRGTRMRPRKKEIRMGLKGDLGVMELFCNLIMVMVICICICINTFRIVVV